jgi:hypothetical protein
MEGMFKVGIPFIIYLRLLQVVAPSIYQSSFLFILNSQHFPEVPTRFTVKRVVANPVE